MKRGHLMTGIVYVAVGILLLALSSLTEGRLGSLLFAFGFAGAGVDFGDLLHRILQLGVGA